MQPSDAVLFETPAPHIAVVTINRPEARNAINAAVAEGLEAAVKRIEADDDIRVAVLTSAGDRSFSAGADLTEVAAGRGREISRKDGGFAGFVQAARSKPWIAAVRGVALGGGLELCLACDMVVASDGASFGLPEVKRGIFAGAGGIIRLPRAIPRAIALEMIATGEPITAQRALDLGLVNRTAAPDQVLEQALALAGVIAANAPVSVRSSLHVARHSDDFDEADLWRLNADAGRPVMSSQDAKGGPRAVGETRAPIFTGPSYR